MAGRGVHQGYAPGVIGKVAAMHGQYYARHWGFDSFFEARVAADCANFFQTYNADRDAFWALMEGDEVLGSVAIDGSYALRDGAQLRWFIVNEARQGQGVGKLLLRQAIGFCRQKGYRRIYLDTFAGLEAARHLYEQAGFRLVSEREGTQWGARVREQRFELELDEEEQAN